MPSPVTFLLSPAFLGGNRGRMLMDERAAFPLAARLREGGAGIGEVFSFVSQLYFRGKLHYARAFARPASGLPGALVITSTRGLVDPDATVTRGDLAEMGAVDIDADLPAFRAPFAEAVRALAAADPAGAVVLLGSVASGKYVDVLLAEMGERLLFPVEFVGRGDMSRGALMLRAAESGVELEYQPVAGAVRRGPRAPKVPPRR